MAARYFRNTGDLNWSTATNWSATSGGASVGAIPTASDDVFFDANSGNCVLDNTTAKVAKSLDCTGYSGNLTFNVKLTISGNITLSNTMTMSGAAVEAITLNAAATITTNGKTISVPFYLNSTNNFTFVGDATFTNELKLSAYYSKIDGSNIYVGGNFIITIPSSVAGTATFILNGTSIVTSSSTLYIRNPIVINTAGTITFNSDFAIVSNFTYTAGTIIWKSVYSLYVLDSLILALSGYTLPRLICATAGRIIQITGDTVISDNLTITGTPASPIQIKSNSSGTKRKLTLNPGCSQDVGYCNPTDINSNDGYTIFTYKGAITNTDNWTNLVSSPSPIYMTGVN